MATYIKRGEKWIVQLCVKGQRACKSFSTKNEAKDWARLEEHRMNHSKGVLQGKTLGDAFQRYALEETPKKKSARSEAIRLKKLERDKISSVMLADLVHADFDDLIKRRQAEGLKGSSINRELEHISAVLKQCKPWRWMENNPFQGVKRPKNPPPRDKAITEEEQRQIILALDYEESKPVVTHRQRIGVAFLLAIETAMRYGEIWGMDWKYVNWEKRQVHLPETKNGSTRDVPLSTRAVELLRKLEPKKAGLVVNTNPRSSEVIFRRAVELAGHRGIITFHDSRHTAITRMAKKITNVLDLARISGHKDIRMLMTYYNPTTQSLAEQLG